ncbi:MAG TPA: hypothetical protein VL354_03765 [Spirochaetia bacterium]|nr:hypothetical protein [Spirochaetia bacterium]
MLQFPVLKFWREEDLYKLQVQAVSRFMQCDTPEAVEASLEFAHYLNNAGLDSDNYPLFLEILRNENSYVTEALIGAEKAFDLFTRVQPSPYIVGFCFQVLRSYKPGGVNDRTLELIFGILYRSYHSAKEGNALYPLSIEDVNAVGKFLDKEKPQTDPINRFILDILADIAEYRSINNENPVVDKNSSHATAIRNAFFDRRLSMTTVMPPEILVRGNYLATTVKPRKPKKLGISTRTTK